MEDLNGATVPLKSSLWRRDCNGGTPGAEVQIIDDLEATNGVKVDCDNDTSCHVVKFTVTRAEDLNHPIVVTAEKRVTG